MKAYIKTLLLSIFISLTACEDVIDVDVPSTNSRLVIEASLDRQKGTLGNNQTIKLSTSTPYFDTTVNNSVMGASVKVTNTTSNVIYEFEDQNDGTYTISNFEPVVNNTYSLEVIHNNETYVATETLIGVNPIKKIEQSLEGGFDDDVLDVSIFWDDPENEENFYLLSFIEEGDLFPILEEYPDEFVNGNELNEFFEKNNDEDDEDSENNDNKFKPGDRITITLYGISKQYNNYIALLIEQYDSAGYLFSAVPAQLKGNCINVTTPKNYAFGYFKLSEFDEVNYTFD